MFFLPAAALPTPLRQRQKTTKSQCPYLLKFVDIVLNVEVTTDLIIKLRIRRMVFTKPLVDIHVKYEL